MSDSKTCANRLSRGFHRSEITLELRDCLPVDLGAVWKTLCAVSLS